MEIKKGGILTPSQKIITKSGASNTSKVKIRKIKMVKDNMIKVVSQVKGPLVSRKQNQEATDRKSVV